MPIFALDDDDWLAVFQNLQTFLNSIEWDYIGEIVLAFDCCGRILELSRGECGGAAISGPRLDPSTIQTAIERFYSTWTDQPAPIIVAADIYTSLASLARTLPTLKVRSRKKPC